MQTRTEGTTTFVTDSEENITKKMPVFYNPVMKRNRDLTLFVLATMKHPSVCLPMEASGIRAARILHELAQTTVQPKQITINDISPTAITFAKKNVRKNLGTYPKENVTFSVSEASKFLLAGKHFDYIDIDPFGTPNPFLDAAVQRIQRNGILAITATDTAALTGTYPRATKKKYWAIPSRTWVMHEIGLRILIRKVQLIAAQYDIALLPVLSVATNHYYRIFFRHMPSNKTIQELLAQHSHVHVDTNTLEVTPTTNSADPGPLWIGTLHDKAFVKLLCKNNIADDTKKLLETIYEECTVEQLGFYDMHKIASMLKKEAPRKEAFFNALGAMPTHISPTGFKTTASLADIKKHY